VSAFSEDKLTYFSMWKNCIKIVLSVPFERSTKLQLVTILCNISEVHSECSSAGQVAVTGRETFLLVTSDSLWAGRSED
jgi:hypothetical protein